MAPPSLSEDFIRTLLGFPKYILQWTVSLLIAVLSDLHITALALSGVFVGLAIGSILWGFATFFLAYSVSRVIANHAEGTAYGARVIRDGLSAIAES